LKLPLGLVQYSTNKKRKTEKVTC